MKIKTFSPAVAYLFEEGLINSSDHEAPFIYKTTSSGVQEIRKNQQ